MLFYLAMCWGICASSVAPLAGNRPSVLTDTLCDLPGDVQSQIESFMAVTVKDKYLLLINKAQFTGFLEKLKDYALLGSKREAAELFWFTQKNDINQKVKLNSLTVELYFKALKSTRKSLVEIERVTAQLIEVAKGYLRLRSLLLSWVKDGCLNMDIDRVGTAIGGINLIASANIRELRLPWCVIEDANPVNT